MSSIQKPRPQLCPFFYSTPFVPEPSGNLPHYTGVFMVSYPFEFNCLNYLLIQLFLILLCPLKEKLSSSLN